MKSYISIPGLGLALLLGVAFNLHFTDLGETYVARNLLAWIVLAALAFALFLKPAMTRRFSYNKDWLIAFGIPVVGAFIVLAINVADRAPQYQYGFYFLPGLLFVWAAFMLGMANLKLDAKQWVGLLLVGLVAFLPQYITHFIPNNPILFFNVSIDVPRIMVKSFAGFGQYNLFGSFVATLLLLAAWGFVFLPMARWQRIALAVLFFFYVIEIPTMNSKTGSIGFAAGLILMGVHVKMSHASPDLWKRFGMIIALSVIGYGLVTLVGAYSDKTVLRADWSGDSMSILTRWTMWVVAAEMFMDAPLFGHGLGSYGPLYLEHFSRYGLERGLTYYPVVMQPHNLVMHLLAETGLVGFVLLLGPFLFFAYRIFKTNPHRWLVAALCFPIVFHCMLELPYIASGSHYMMLGLALMAGLFGTQVSADEKIVPHEKRLAVFGTFSVHGLLCLVVIGVCVHMQMAVSAAATKFATDSLLPPPAFIKSRYESADVSHPVIGLRMRAMSDLVLTRLALEREEIGLLRGSALPRLEQNVIPFYANKGVWEVALQAYYRIGDVAGYEQLVDKIAQFDPLVAQKYRDALSQSLQPNPSPGSSPRPQ